MKDAADAGFVWRGAQERGAVREFLSDVAWGRLDTLLVDLPPGTQRLAELHGLVPGLAGALAVTIPSAASRDAVARSLDLAETRGIRVLGVVENMAGARCDECGALAHLHTGSAGEDLAKRFDIPLLARIPFDRRLATAADEGTLDAWFADAGPEANLLAEWPRSCAPREPEKAHEVPLRRLRPADELRGAGRARRRHDGGRVPLSCLRPEDRDAGQSDGDAAREFARREGRRPDRTRGQPSGDPHRRGVGTR